MSLKIVDKRGFLNKLEKDIYKYLDLILAMPKIVQLILDYASIFKFHGKYVC